MSGVEFGHPLNVYVKILDDGIFMNRIGKVTKVTANGWHTVTFQDNTTKIFRTKSLQVVPGPLKKRSLNIRSPHIRSPHIRSPHIRSPHIRSIHKRSPMQRKSPLKKSINKKKPLGYLILSGKFAGSRCKILKETCKTYVVKLYINSTILENKIYNLNKSSSEIDLNTCINTTTFVNLESTKDIPNDNLIRFNGYCFDSEELCSLVDSGNFDNKNPHNNKLELFDINNLNLYEDYPNLHESLIKYVKKVNKKLYEEIEILSKYPELLYQICITGGICISDNLTSHDTADSSIFNNSIISLGDLSKLLFDLPKNEKKIIENISVRRTLKNIIEDANKGETCIHGIGNILIELFIHYFIELEKRTGIIYDSTITGIYFVKNNLGYTFIVDRRYRLFHNTSVYFTDIQKYFSHNTSLTKIVRQDLKCINKRICEEVPEWRIIKFDNYCMDIYNIIKTITDQLNNYPYPIKPMNPVTRKIFTPEEIKYIFESIDNNGLQISDSLYHYRKFQNKSLVGREFINSLLKYYETVYRRFLYYSNNLNDPIRSEWALINKPIGQNENILIKYLDNNKYINKPLDLETFFKLQQSLNVDKLHKIIYFRETYKLNLTDSWYLVKYSE